MQFFQRFPLTFYDPEGTNKYNLVTNILRRYKFRDDFKDNADHYLKYQVQDTDMPEHLAAKWYGSTAHWWVILMLNNMVDPNYDWPLNQHKLSSYLDRKYPDECFFLWTVVGNFKRGESVSNNRGHTKTVYRWSPTYRRLEVGEHTEGYFEIGDTITGATSGATGVLKRWVLENTASLHHFTSGGDPDGEYLNPWDTDNNYLNGYINSSTDTHVVTNFVHENAKNEEKREIKMLKPELLGVVINHADRIFQPTPVSADTFTNLL